MSQIPYLSTSAARQIAQFIAAELLKKVNVENGKGLSANDFTNALKTKLESINTDDLLTAAEKAKIHEHSNKSILDVITQAAVDAWNAAQTNVIESVKVNGTTQTITNKTVDITVPTAISTLTNDSGFQTASQVAAAIAAAVDAITNIDFSIVNSLPASGVKGTIYLVAASGGADPDVYDEYIWLDGTGNDPGRFEKIGTTEAKFSNYWSKSELTFSEITAADVTAIFNEVFYPSQQGE